MADTHSTKDPYYGPNQDGKEVLLWPIDGGAMKGTSPAFPNGIMYPTGTQTINKFVEHYNSVVWALGTHTHSDLQARIDKIETEIEALEDDITAQMSLPYARMSTSVVENYDHGYHRGFNSKEIIDGDPSNPDYLRNLTGNNTVVFVAGRKGSTSNHPETPAFCIWNTEAKLFQIIEMTNVVEGERVGKLLPLMKYKITYITHQKDA